MAHSPKYVLFAGALLFLVTALSFLDVYYEPNTCSMSYSRPSSVEINVQSPSSKVSTRYRTYLYQEGGVSKVYTGPHTLGGTPVIFIPGNAGSHSQGRSLAALAINLGEELGTETPFDFFLLHFSEDMSALHGKTIVDEAAYVNDAISHILGLYAQHGNLAVVPSSVIVLCHSMGGIVARTAVTLDNYIPGSINTIFTLSTPHIFPPLTLDKDVTMVYDSVNQYWRNCYSEKHSPMENTTLVSISGGHIDHMVVPDSTPVDSLIPVTHGLSAFTYSIPKVWRGIDHLAIMWCAELRSVIVDSLYKIVDSKSPERTIPVTQRMQALKSAFKSPIDSLTENDTLVWHDRTEKAAYFETPVGFFEVNPKQDSNGLVIPVAQAAHHSSLLWTVLTGISVPLIERYTNISLPTIKSSLLSLQVEVLPQCQPSHAGANDIPLAIRSWTARESRWYVGNTARIVWYSESPYMPFDDSRGLYLQIFAPEICSSGPSHIARIKVDWWATLSNLAINYRASLATYPLAVVLICVFIQLRAFHANKHISFSDSLSIFTEKYLLHIAKGLAVTHLALCWRPLRNLIRSLQMPSERYNIHALQRQTFDIHDMLVGVDEPLLFWIPPLLLVMATAALMLVHQVLSAIVFANGWLQNAACRGCRGPPVPQSLKNPAVYIIGNLFWLSALFFIPYQVVFIAVTVFLLSKTVDADSWQYTFSMLFLWTCAIDGPILVVWAHNINFEWSLAFSTYRNIVAAAPIVILVYFLSQHPSPIPPPCDNVLLKRFTYACLIYMATYALVYGAMHTFMMHHLVNYFAGWLLTLYMERPQPRKLQ
ncbi:Putative GPI inositol-deacylase C [Wickerhamiella sorbophila]|uniref:GPI inositol-deacylase n=1 Tax=Wickerhamiella sorbophila TaxID=45607 RepID=A0A2T0FD68_9ASCO|nr:Putative GPI inositol-deacylase C [Wickerhamiella sorbophila]PRT52910.1 Putative GPI inositol-deacylase C [Wickerhamiella sorbophila]